MKITTITKYTESVMHPFGLFRTLGEPVCELDHYGDPIVFAGGSAAVFKIRICGKCYALKCYTKPKPHASAIYDLIGTISSPLLHKTQYLPKEIYIYDNGGAGEWRDVLLTEWIEDKTLEYELRKALHYNDTKRFEALSRSFDTMAHELLSSSWAHGDLKPNNITVTGDGLMHLLDYDAVYLPAMTSNLSLESGTPQYNHPLRNTDFFNKQIDDYSIAVLSATLRTLAAMPTARKGLEGKELVLFPPQQVISGKSVMWSKAVNGAAENGDAITYRLLQFLTNPSPVIDGIGEIMNFAANGCPAYKAEPEPYREYGIWGYKTNDAVIIPPLFDSALEFSEGLAAVKIGKHNHFIDTNGRTVINCSRFEQVKPFSCGLAAVKSGELWGYIDKSGATILSAEYVSAGSFRYGKAKVTTGSGTVKTISNPFKTQIP